MISGPQAVLDQDIAPANLGEDVISVSSYLSDGPTPLISEHRKGMGGFILVTLRGGGVPGLVLGKSLGGRSSPNGNRYSSSNVNEAVKTCTSPTSLLKVTWPVGGRVRREPRSPES